MTNEILKKMMEVERRAKDIVSQADNRKSHIDEEINTEVSKMNSEYTKKANARVEKVMTFEKELADKKLEDLHENTEKSLAEIKKIYAENKDSWLEQLYKKIVG